MQTVLQKIQALQETLKGLTMKPEYQKALDKKFRLEFNYNSNHIEGNTLTYNETELLLLFDDTKGGHTMREYEEMKAHDVAFQLVKDWADDEPHTLTESSIRQLNEIILVRPFWKEAITPDGQDTRRLIKVGEYKEHPNSVRLQNGEIFEYTSPTDTPIKMGELIAWYREEEAKKELHPVALAALLHYKFVCIHPFDDGNGRVSRLLMNYVLLKNGLPPVVIKTADKSNYLSALHSADTGDLDTFVKYIGEQLIWSLELNIKAGKEESVEEPDDWGKKVSLLEVKINAKKELQERIKMEKAEAIKSWLKSNYENLVKAFEVTFKPFDNLYSEKHFYKTIFHSNKKRPIVENSIEQFGKFLDGGIFDFKIGLEYHLKGLIKYPQAPLGTDLILGIAFDDDTVKLIFTGAVKGTKAVSLYENLSADELNPIKEVGEMLYQKIEDYINKLP